jgi:hypothetical protein
VSPFTGLTGIMISALHIAMAVSICPSRMPNGSFGGHYRWSHQANNWSFNQVAGPGFGSWNKREKIR